VEAGAGEHLGTDDTRPGFAKALAIAPQTLWPADSSLSITLKGVKDAAGNAVEITLGPRTIESQPDSNSNLGFEANLDGWITDPLPPTDPRAIPPVRAVAGFTVDNKDSTQTEVTPVEGSQMAVLEDGTSLFGYLVPPAGAQRLTLSAAVVDFAPADLQTRHEGFAIELVTNGERVTVAGADASALPPVTDPDAGWTGFGKVSIDLPASASTGFWIILSPTGFAPPINNPTLLVDALAFE
jgi:hypothetical protein